MRSARRRLRCPSLFASQFISLFPTHPPTQTSTNNEKQEQKTQKYKLQTTTHYLIMVASKKTYRKSAKTSTKKKSHAKQSISTLTQFEQASVRKAYRTRQKRLEEAAKRLHGSNDQPVCIAVSGHEEDDHRHYLRYLELDMVMGQEGGDGKSDDWYKISYTLTMANPEKWREWYLASKDGKNENESPWITDYQEYGENFEGEDAHFQITNRIKELRQHVPEIQHRFSNSIIDNMFQDMQVFDRSEKLLKN